MLSFFKKIFGTKSDADIKKLESVVVEINEAFAKLNGISNDELRAKTDALKVKIKAYIQSDEDKILALTNQAENTSDLDLEKKDDLYKEIDGITKDISKKIEEVLKDILPEAFAIVKETARRFKENKEINVTASEHDKGLVTRKKDYVTINGNQATFKNAWKAAGMDVTWDMVHYDVQLIGGLVLHSGKISEMATGEGKTLVGTLPIFLNALAGKGVHIVTVNNYLSKRDSQWNGPIFEFHGLTVDCIDLTEPNSEERRAAYQADITYGTNNEFGFDYLRDNMARGVEDIVQRKHHFAIVDEVDSVLIDDARTPLIISGPTPTGDRHEFLEFKPRIEKLVNAQKAYVQTCIVDAKKYFAEGKEKEAGIPLLRAHRGFPKSGALIKFLSETGVRALLQKTENYYMQDQNKEMHKIDSELFFVIEEKMNSIDMTEKGLELINASVEDKNFFIIPDVGGQIADIEKTIFDPKEKAIKKDALMQEFSIKSERIHTVQQLLKAYCMFDKDTEYVIDEGKIKIVDEQTGRIMEGRRYSDGLHQAIEAKENVKIEAATQTYATITLQNYFRMYHKLAGMTGTAETESKELWDIYKLDVVVIPTNRPISRKDEQDLIYKTNKEKYKAVIERSEKYVAAGRPVLIGTTSVEISELLSKMLTMRKIKHNVLNAKLHQREADIVAEAGQAGTVTIATNMAGRGTDIKLGAGVKDAGGLAIVGTERHESRRVDRQLRGRAGRQGDPGSSEFYASLEDNLMRLFGGDRLAKMMDRMGLEEGEVITHSMVTKSIERAQKKVEENNYGIRKRLIEYDDVMNAQRDVIYKKRKNALYGDRLSIDIANLIYDLSENLVADFKTDKDFEGLNLELIKVFSIEAPFDKNTFLGKDENELTFQLFEAAMLHYKEKSQSIADRAFPVIRDVHTNSGNQYENIAIPFSDGIRNLNMVVNLKQAFESKGKDVSVELEKALMLTVIDEEWKEHLREMDDLKQAVQNASLEQKDPLLIYKLESFELFKKMVGKINKDAATYLFKFNIADENGQIQQAKAPQQEKKVKLVESRDEQASEGRESVAVNENGEPMQQQERPKQVPVRVDKTVGRNDPCPCGSGKKFKNCHG
jgi:preprotein translocase subunit SecA